MDYEVRLGPELRKVALTRRSGEPETYDFHEASSGTARRLTVIERTADHLLLSVDDRIYSVRPVSRGTARVTFLLNGEVVTAGRPAPEGASRTEPAPGSLNEILRAHFPSKVVDVRVASGERVRAGATLFVLEAMKMETNLDAPVDCTVVEVFVQPGQMVAREAPLARLDFSPGPAEPNGPSAHRGPKGPRGSDEPTGLPSADVS